MRKLVIFVALCCIGVAVHFGFIRKPPVGERVRILPGIEVVFTRDENAADYYAKACESLSGRYIGPYGKDGRIVTDHEPESLTPEERKWFMLGTSCRRSSWYPEHSPHITDPADQAAERANRVPGTHRALAFYMMREGRSAEEAGDVKTAMDIWKRMAVFGWHTESEEEYLTLVLVGMAIEEMAYREFIRHYRERGDMDQARRYEGFKQRLRAHNRERYADLRTIMGLKGTAYWRRMQSIALSHESAMMRKEACMLLAHPDVVRNPSLRQDAVTTLRRISSEDPDPLVREMARNMIPYVLGQKALP